MKLKKTLMCVALSLTLGIQGCVNWYRTDADDFLTENEPETFKTSGLKACGVFALAFAAVCLSTDARTCVFLPALGCTIGYTADYLLDKIREKYAKYEDQLDALQVIAEDELKGTKTLICLLRDNLDKDRETLRKLREEYKQEKADYLDYMKEYNRIANNINYTQERIKEQQNAINVEYEVYNKLNGGRRTGWKVAFKKKDLEKKLEEATEQYEALIRMVTEYADATCMYYDIPKKAMDHLDVVESVNLAYNSRHLEMEKQIKADKEAGVRRPDGWYRKHYLQRPPTLGAF